MLFSAQKVITYVGLRLADSERLFKKEYFKANPEAVELYLQGIFEDYADDPDNAVLLTQLRVIARVKGISEMAEQIGITRQGLQKALSGRGNPRLENINAIVKAMGYQITLQRIVGR